MRAADLPLHYNAVDILERNLAERSAKSRRGRLGEAPLVFGVDARDTPLDRADGAGRELLG